MGVVRRLLAPASLAIGVAVVGGCLASVDRFYGDAVIGDGGVPEGSGPDETAGAVLHPATIGGAALGIAGVGLVLQNAGNDDLAVLQSGPFAFTTKLFPKEPYAIKVLTQPTFPSQKCSVTNGEGVAAGVDITNIDVACVTDAYKIGGPVVGLVGSGLVLQNNGSNDLAVTGDTFAFVVPVPSAGNFNVTIKTQPAGQVCSVGGGTGTVVAGDVSSVLINCLAKSYTIGGSVSGLAGSLVVQNNGANDLLLTANGSFAFSPPLTIAAKYDVTVKTPPTSPIAQTCSVGQGSGIAAANITSVKVACTTNRYTVSGTVDGLTGTLVLRNNGGNDTTITADGTFTFSTSIASGSAYAVTAMAQPANQACQVTNGSGAIGSADVDSVTVKCSPLIAFSENFDGVVAPALPAGWTSTAVAGGVSWRTDTGASSSVPNSMFIDATTDVVEGVVDSPAFMVGSSVAELSFQSQWSMPNKFGGGVLEIAIDGGAFQDIIAVGGVFKSAPYIGSLSSPDSPIGTRSAWTGGGPPALTATAVRLPAVAAGKSVQLRWRFVTFSHAETKAWRFDDVLVKN